MSSSFDAHTPTSSNVDDDFFGPSMDEPDLEGGLRHLSVSSDGTIDSIVSGQSPPPLR